MLHVDVAELERLIQCGIHPPYVWKPGWVEPKWDDNGVRVWAQILIDVDLDALADGNVPTRPPIRAYRSPTPDEIAAAAQMLGLRP